MKQPAVYLMASRRNGTLYVGVTSNLVQRVWQHRTHAVAGFTDKYDVTLLVWFEQHATMASAIAREKAIKKWNRAWKIEMLEKQNPEWQDLWPAIIGAAAFPQEAAARESSPSPAPASSFPRTRESTPPDPSFPQSDAPSPAPSFPRMRESTPPDPSFPQSDAPSPAPSFPRKRESTPPAPSFPRRRESMHDTQAKNLDSRLRGNDEVEET